MQNSLLKHIFWQKLDGVLLSDCRCGLVTVGGCLVTASPIPLVGTGSRNKPEHELEPDPEPKPKAELKPNPELLINSELEPEPGPCPEL